MYRKIDDIRSDIKLALKKKHIKQEDMETYAGLSQGQISRVINGKRISPAFIKICNYVLVSPYLIDDAGYDPLKDESFIAAINLAVQRSPSRARKIQEILKATAGI
ncbi:helix-turn-helix domain-containing protein [Cellvibrio sp. OA-2007]|uniref:helix-turn-helix domain-containing protein n=1 Tax=Cellvibrio sp. OA-2007 TaxID=529823 RepID=UPI0007802C96|nr:helix-turn-helix transcriptional regulator [Cellvibrio sp. OA-2007]